MGPIYGMFDGDAPSPKRLKNPPTTHALKTLPAYFADVWHRVKTFEIRKDDRNFRVGDDLRLQEWDGADYTGRSISARVTYKINDPEFCKEGYCVLGIVVQHAWDDGV